MYANLVRKVGENMKKNNLMTILSFVASILGLIIALIWPDGDTAIMGVSIATVIGIIGVVLGFVGKKKIKTTQEKGKGFALAGIIIGFIDIVWCGLAIFSFIAIQDINYNDATICTMDNMTKNCIDNGDGTSTCRYSDVYDVPCSTDKLKDTQFKK